MRKDKVFEYRENLQITTEILEAKFDSIINSQQNVEHLKTEPFASYYLSVKLATLRATPQNCLTSRMSIRMAPKS